MFILYYIILYYIILYYIILYYLVLYRSSVGDEGAKLRAVREMNGQYISSRQAQMPVHYVYIVLYCIILYYIILYYFI